MNQPDLLEVLVHDSPEPCPYLPSRTARMPLRLPRSNLTPQQLDDRLAEGDRRSGMFLYRTQCPQCRACEPIRIAVEEFSFSRTQRRTLRRGNQLIDVEIGESIADRQRVELYNAHRRQRGLVGRDGEIDETGYAAFLVDSCCDSFEIRYRLRDRLIAVSIFDRGLDSLSAVYCYFDPAYSHLSPGSFSILKQIELCRQWGKRFLYLGLYIAESAHMSYKAQFLPHERRIAGTWCRFERHSPSPRE